MNDLGLLSQSLVSFSKSSPGVGILIFFDYDASHSHVYASSVPSRLYLERGDFFNSSEYTFDSTTEGNDYSCKT